MKRVALIIQYDGSFFSGWQRQKNAISVQETIENALFNLSNQKIKTFAAGRTDAGVHASGQVVHFDIEFIPGLVGQNHYQCTVAANGKVYGIPFDAERVLE